MKIEKLLFATLLCGAFGMFTACSDDDGPIDLPDTNEPVAEEVDTYLALATSINNGNLSTRAAVDEQPGTDPEVNQIKSLAFAVFEVKGGKPGNLITIQMKTSDVKPDDQEQKESKGFYMDPIKFKIAPDKDGKAQVAVVAFANYEKLFDNLKDGDISTFEKFKTYTTSKMYNNYGSNYHFANEDNESGFPTLYPMSSNVLYYIVKAGYVNSVGYKESLNALDFTNTYYKYADENKLTDTNNVADSMIPLYRGAAEIELTSITFADYAENMKFDHFILEEVFLMNVPTMVNWFDPTLPGADGYIKDWGGDLNEAYETYKSKEFTYNKTSYKSFISGNKRVGTDPDVPGSIPFVPGEFCSQEMFDNTNFDFKFKYDHNKGANGENGNYRSGAIDSPLSFFSLDPNHSTDVYGMFDKPEFYSMKVEKASVSVGSPEFKFAVSPSNYSLGTDSQLDSEKAICLVVRGRYYYKTGNQVVGPDNDSSSDSRYYTVVVNKAGESTIKDKSVPQHYNCVKRNVRYEIALTINGPGSETPWGYDKNSYVVPKVTIVPFGTVEQNSTLD